MDYETIRVERIGDVLKIVLNRPERLNACPPNMALEITDAVGDVGGYITYYVTDYLFGQQNV